MPILNYDDIDLTPLFAGQVATMEPSLPGRTAFNRSGSMIPMGCAVAVNPAAGSTMKDLILPNATGLLIVGIASISDIFEKVTGESVIPTGDFAGTPAYPTNHELTFRSFCTIGVQVETAVTAISNGVFVRHTAPGTQQLGAFRTDADGTNADALPNARWAGLGAAGSVVPLSIALI